MADIEQKIIITTETNAEETSKKVDTLVTAQDENVKATEKQNASTKTFKAQLREANQELQKQIQLTGEGSKETIEAAKQVANLKDQMGFAKDLADSFNPDQKMKALGAATQVAGTGLQGVTAGMALFGGESEDTQKQLLKVQAAMAFSDAISNLSNLGDQWQLLKSTVSSSTLATKANVAATGLATIVQNVFTGSVATTTAGFKALKFAIAATGIGLLAVALVAVYQNFEKISKFATDLVPGLESIGVVVKSIVNSVTDFIGVTSEADRAMDRLKDNAKASTALNEKYLAEHGDQLDEFTKQKIEAKNRYNEELQKDGANQMKLAERLNRELLQIDKSRGEDQRKQLEDNNAKLEAERLARIESEKSSEKKLLQDVQDLQDKSEEQKLARQKARDIAEIKALEKKGVDVRESLRLNTEKYNILENELKAKRVQELKDADALRDQELKDADEKVKAERIEKEKEQGNADIARAEYLYEQKKKKKADDAADDAAEVEQKRRNAEDILATGDALITGTKMLAGKNKALQKAAIITEGAVSLGKVGVNIATGVSKDASTGAVASIPQIIKTLATGAISTASIIANTSKALSAIGGGGGGSIGSGASPTGTSATPQVQFQNSSENQIANSVNQAQQNLQVTVLESDISKAQGNVKVLVNENSF